MKKNPLLWILSAAAVLILLCVVLLNSRVTPRYVNAESSVGTEDNPNARLQHEWMMLHDPATNEIPRDIRRREMTFAQSLPVRAEFQKSGSTAAATWVSRGPWNVGGRTRALGIDVSNPDVILAGGVSGGMWRSADGGTTWTKTTQPGSLHSVSCIAQDRRSGHTATWYYGSGENIANSASGMNGDAYLGDGVFKSVDNGVTWALLSSTSNGNPHLFTSHWDYVWNIAVHPATGDVYAATFNAIMRSQDGGTTWTLVRGGGNTAPFSEISDVAIASNGTIYATGSPGSVTLQGIWKSTDGTNWTNITPGDMSVVRRIVIGSAPSNPDVVYFLAETPQLGVNDHSIWQYNATANTYQNLSANLPAFGEPVGNFNSQGSYDLVITVKPDNDNVVIIGGTNLYRSTDGFSSTANTTWIGGYATTNDISQYANHHPDQHALAWAPNNPSVLFSGHDGGVSKSANVLATPHVWQQLSRGYLTTQFYTVALDHATSGSSTIIGGLQDNGCWGTTSPSPTATWIDVNPPGGDGAATAVANGGAFYCGSSQNGWTNRVIPGPSPQQYARIDPQGGSGYLFVNPFVLDANNSNIMYLAGGNYVWRNSDITAIPLGNRTPTSINWTRLDNAAFTSNRVSALGVSTANPANRLYVAGFPDGLMFRVDNANTASYTVTDVGAALPRGYINCVAVDATDGNKALVVFSNYNLASLWYTADGGATWTDVEGNLAGASGPSCRYATIVTHGGVTTYLLGTSTGLYSTMSLNGAATVWSQEGASTIGNVVVTYLDSRNSDGVVVVGTHANGVYSSAGSVDVGQEKEVPSGFTLEQNYPNPFNPVTNIEFRIPNAGHVSLKVYDLLGRKVATLVDELQAPGVHTVQFNGSTLASGVYSYRLETSGFSATRKLVLVR